MNNPDTKLTNDGVPLLLVVKKQLAYSDSPWKKIMEIVPGDVVKFDKMFVPKVAAHNQCRVHGNGSNKCKNICIIRNGKKYYSNVCFDASEHYFDLYD